MLVLIVLCNLPALVHRILKYNSRTLFDAGLVPQVTRHSTGDVFFSVREGNGLSESMWPAASTVRFARFAAKKAHFLTEVDSVHLLLHDIVVVCVCDRWNHMQRLDVM